MPKYAQRSTSTHVPRSVAVAPTAMPPATSPNTKSDGTKYESLKLVFGDFFVLFDVLVLLLDVFVLGDFFVVLELFVVHELFDVLVGLFLILLDVFVGLFVGVEVLVVLDVTFVRVVGKLVEVLVLDLDFVLAHLAGVQDGLGGLGLGDDREKGEQKRGAEAEGMRDFHASAPWGGKAVVILSYFSGKGENYSFGTVHETPVDFRVTSAVPSFWAMPSRTNSSPSNSNEPPRSAV